jgi:multidrug resistance efflux pump
LLANVLAACDVAMPFLKTKEALEAEIQQTTTTLKNIKDQYTRHPIHQAEEDYQRLLRLQIDARQELENIRAAIVQARREEQVAHEKAKAPLEAIAALRAQLGVA